MNEKRKATVWRSESEEGTSFLAIIAIVIALIIGYLFYNKELKVYLCHHCGAKMVEEDSETSGIRYDCSRFPMCRNTFYNKSK